MGSCRQVAADLVIDSACRNQCGLFGRPKSFAERNKAVEAITFLQWTIDALLGLGLLWLAWRTGEAQPDAVPHAMVITGIVVAVSATALALTLMVS